MRFRYLRGELDWRVCTWMSDHTGLTLQETSAFCVFNKSNRFMTKKRANTTWGRIVNSLRGNSFKKGNQLREGFRALFSGASSVAQQQNQRQNQGKWKFKRRKKRHKGNRHHAMRRPPFSKAVIIAGQEIKYHNAQSDDTETYRYRGYKQRARFGTVEYFAGWYLDIKDIQEVIYEHSVHFRSNDHILNRLSQIPSHLHNSVYYAISSKSTLPSHPKRSSLKVQKSTLSKQLPKLYPKMTHVPTSHPCLSDTFVREGIGLHLKHHHDLGRLIEAWRRVSAMSETVTIPLDGSGLENDASDGPLGVQLRGACQFLNMLMDGTTIEYEGMKDLKIFFKVVPRAYKMGKKGKAIPDKNVVCQLYNDKVNFKLVLLNVEVKSPATCLSLGFDSLTCLNISSNGTTVRKDHAQAFDGMATVLNEQSILASRELADLASKYEGTEFKDLPRSVQIRYTYLMHIVEGNVKDSYQKVVEASEDNCIHAFIQGYSQALAAQSRCFAVHDAVSTFFVERTGHAEIGKDSIQANFNVHYSPIEEENQAVMFTRFIFNNFCFMIGSSIRDQFDLYTDDEHRFVGTEYSHFRSDTFKHEMETKWEKEWTECGAILDENRKRILEEALQVPNAVVERWDIHNSDTHVTLQEPEYLGYSLLDREETQAAVYKRGETVVKLWAPTPDGLDSYLNETVAYNIIADSSDREATEYIPKLHKWGVMQLELGNKSGDDEMLFIELDYVKGYHVSVDEVKEQVHRAIDLFARAGVAHNDISEGNIICDQSTGKVKIFDFDSATATSPEFIAS